MAHPLDDIAKQLRALHRKDIACWLKQGELLAEAQRLAETPQDFQTWLRKNGFARRNAYKAIAAWRDFGAVQTSAQFSREAMSILAQSATAREKAIELSQHQAITAKLARQLVREHTGDAAAPNRSVKTVPTPAGGVLPYRELFTVEGGFGVTITGPGTPSPADLLGVIVAVQRQLRERMVRSAA